MMHKFLVKHRTLSVGDGLVAYDACFVDGCVPHEFLKTLRYVLSSLEVECVLNLIPRWYDEILLTQEKLDDGRDVVYSTMLEEINWQRCDEGYDVVTHELILGRENEIT